MENKYINNHRLVKVNVFGSAASSTLVPGWTLFAFKHEAAAAAFQALWNNGHAGVPQVLCSLPGSSMVIYMTGGRRGAMIFFDCRAAGSHYVYMDLRLQWGGIIQPEWPGFQESGIPNWFGCSPTLKNCWIFFFFYSECNLFREQSNV